MLISFIFRQINGESTLSAIRSRPKDGQILPNTPRILHFFTLSVKTTLQEPPMTKTEAELLDRSKSVQHCELPDCSEVLKRFSSNPAFTNLESNGLYHKSNTMIYYY